MIILDQFRREREKRNQSIRVGLAEGCRVTRSLSQDQLLTYDDVEIPANRLAHKLRADQDI